MLKFQFCTSELYKGRKLNIFHLYVFGCKCFILNNEENNLEKFDAKVDEGIFKGYFISRKTFRLFNNRTLTIKESIHVTFEKSNHKPLKLEVVDCACIMEKTTLEENQEAK